MKELYEETEMKNRIIFLQYNTQKGQNSIRNDQFDESNNVKCYCTVPLNNTSLEKNAINI